MSQVYVHFCLQPYTLFTLLLPFVYHLFSALAEYQPYVYSTLLFSLTTQTCCSEAEEDLKYFDVVF
jgi:hypothetical protein